MTESASTAPASPQLFKLCAASSADDQHWEWFRQRFNTLLVRSIAVTWKKAKRADFLPPDVAEDLIQEVYILILKNDAQLLRNFNGATEAEAEAYLAHTAINLTRSYLRSRAAIKRNAVEISLQTLLEEQGESALPVQPAPGLTDTQLKDICRQIFAGPNCARDTLIFMLYICEGLSVAEIARLKVCALQENSLATRIAQLRSKLIKYFSGTL